MMRAGWLVFLLVAFAPPARADLRELSGRVADQYRASGARVVSLAPRFLYEDETVALPLPSSGGAKCISVAIVGARGLSFHVVGGDDEEESGQVFSVAGALELSTCDGRDAAPVRIRSDAGRGAIETVVAFSANPVPPLRAVLPERVGGALPPPIDPGPVPPLPAPEKRAETTEGIARRDGATIAPRATATASQEGTGVVHVQLDPGCHRIGLFSPEHVGKRRARLDLDAELRMQDEGALLARDRGEAADAKLEVCLAEKAETLLSFAGAAPLGQIIVARASWALPPTLPDLWGSVARQRMASAMRARHVVPPSRPVALYEGIGGTTPIVTAVEPAACYVAVVGTSRGVPRATILRVLVGAVEHADERGTAEGAALVAFCTGERSSARLTVDARGPGLAWGLALYRMTSGVWEASP